MMMQFSLRVFYWPPDPPNATKKPGTRRAFLHLLLNAASSLFFAGFAPHVLEQGSRRIERRRRAVGALVMAVSRRRLSLTLLKEARNNFV